MLKTSQEESFPEEVRRLRAHVPKRELSQLASEMDPGSGTVRVGG